MLTIDDYCDRAKTAQNLKSDRELGEAIGRSGHLVTQWRTKRNWPSDETMITLAGLAQIDLTQALMDLNRWRAKSPAVSAMYAEIAKKIGGMAAAVAMAVSVMPAGTQGQQSNRENSPVYIMENIE